MSVVCWSAYLKATLRSTSQLRTRVTTYHNICEVMSPSCSNSLLMKLSKMHGADLVMTKTVSLFEALTGLCFTFDHLNGKQVRIRNKPGAVIKPNTAKALLGLGLPR